MKLKDFGALLKETFAEWSDDRAARLAASLAYYTIFSLVPLLVVVIALAGLIGRGTVVQGELMFQLQNLVGEEGRKFIQDLVVTSATRPQTGIMATVVGAVTLLFGALGVFGALQDSLNTIWEVKLKPAKGLGETIKRQVVDRFISFTMVLGIGFMLLVSLVVSAVLEAMGKYMNSLLPFPDAVMSLLNFVISFAVITLMFALMFKILPDAQMAWKDVWLGAAVTAFLFTIGKIAIATYLGRSSINSSYGAAGSLMIILVWIYYSAQILFLGAEFTQVYATRYGQGIHPDDNAVILTELDRARQGMTRRDESPSPSASAPKGVPALNVAPMAAAVAAQTYSDAVPYMSAQGAILEVKSKDARLQNVDLPPVAPSSVKYNLSSGNEQKSLVQEVAAPLAISWLGALVVGTLVHFSFLKSKQ